MQRNKNHITITSTLRPLVAESRCRSADYVSVCGIKTLIVIIGFLITISTRSFGAEEMDTWPEITEIKFISGRAATEKDINDGAAVFLLQSDGIPIGKPINIQIPQYALHTDNDTGEVSKVVVIQAEEVMTNGAKVVGAFAFKSRGFLAGLYEEFKFLGTNKPNE